MAAVTAISLRRMQGDDDTTCVSCGRSWRQGDADGDDWLYVEITRGDGQDGLDWTSAEFCSQPHAAEWFRMPLPPPTPSPPYRMTWRDRLGAGALAVAVGLTVSLALLGVWFLLQQAR